jgi:hypothetical protein
MTKDPEAALTVGQSISGGAASSKQRMYKIARTELQVICNPNQSDWKP